MTKEEKQIEQGLRLQKFYKSLNMNGTEFADSLGVAQSLISFISNGKKPITHTLIEKITERYPNFNEGWLRTGYGSMEFTKLEVGGVEDPPVVYRSAWDAFDLLREKLTEYELRIIKLEERVNDLEQMDGNS